MLATRTSAMSTSPRMHDHAETQDHGHSHAPAHDHAHAHEHGHGHDEHGHEGGDRALALFARCVQQVLRVGDLAAVGQGHLEGLAAVAGLGQGLAQERVEVQRQRVRRARLRGEARRTSGSRRRIGSLSPRSS